MSGASRRAFAPTRLCWIAVFALLAATSACDCNGEDDEEEPTDIKERDRTAEIPQPELAGPAPDDFDPEDTDRIVDPDRWEMSIRGAGPPQSVPEELVITIDRSVVRRDHPDLGPGTVITVTDETGEAIDVENPRLVDRHSVFRADFADDLTPGTSYEVAFEAVEFDFGKDDDGHEDIEFVEFDDPPNATIDTAPMQLLDVSHARPVGAYGHVELRFSAPVDVATLNDRLDWAIDGSTTRTPFYDWDADDPRVATARIRPAGSDFAADVDEVEVVAPGGLASTLGGDQSEPFHETTAVGEQDDTLEIRNVGVYERAGTPTVRVVCHDPNFEDTRSYYWDRDIGGSTRNLSRRCDVDAEQVMEMVDFDGDIDVAVVDHRYGFEIPLDIDEPGGPVNMALRTGDYGEHVAPLFEGYETQLEPSYPDPELMIDADGRYLERSDFDQVPIRHRDVEMAHVTVRHATAEHFVFWLAGNDDNMAGAASRAIAEQYIELDPGPNEARYSYVDLEDLIGDPEPGAYQLEVSAPYNRGVADSHRFVISDIQLIAKRASHTEEEIDEIWAWTIDVDTAEPVDGLELELIRENGTVLADCETDDDGYCELGGNWGDLENEPPFAVVAEGVDELAYIDWEDTRTEIVEGAISGADYTDEPAYRGSLNGERTLYRPGETMHFAGFVRGDGYRAETDLPVSVEITDSRGQDVYTGVYDTDDVGAFEFFYDIPEMASTGTWSVDILAGDKQVATQQVSVDEFVPERIDVELEVDDVYVDGDQGITGQVEAEYFFGTKAANTDFEIACDFEPADPFEDQWPQYEFGPFDENVDSVTARDEGILDDNGRADFQCNPSNYDDRAPYSVTVEASVFEAGSGSPTRSEEQTSFVPGHQLVGLRSPDDRVDTDDGARIEGIVVDPSGDLVETTDHVDLQLGSVRYTRTRMRTGGRLRWERERHESIDERQTVDVDGGNFSFRTPARGSTVGIYVRADHEDMITEFDVDPPRRFWGWHQQDLDPRPDDPTHVAIDGPDEVTVGESAEFSFDAPMDGRALVAVETSRVDSWEWIDVDTGKNTWDVTVDYFDPNVYVSALYVPAGDDVPSELDRGFGVQRVDVSRQHWEADVELDVPDEREPHETLDIDVRSPDAGPDAKVAVAAVDRGILSLANYEFDDPLDQLFTTRALGVDTFDTVGWYADVSPERFGGGALAPPQPAPDAIMPVEPTAMWSGLVALEDGRASIDFDVPDFRGELEIMAVVVDDEHLGEATEHTTIVDPLALQATAPRFATHGDEIEIPVSVTNTTDSTVDVDVSADVLPDMMLYDDDTAALEISGPTTASVELRPDERDEVVFDVDVVGRAGAPRITFEATGNGEQSHHEATVPVYPDGPSTVEQDHHSVATQRFNVVRELDGWLPTSETTELWVTSIPRAPAFEHLDHVLRYPRLRLGHNLYNTVARVRPVVYLDRLLEAADPEGGAQSLGWRMRRGLRGIERLQDSSGRFHFWTTGHLNVGPWGQAYVLDMLTSADEAGFDVPEWVVREGLDWLDRRVQRRHDIEELDLGLWVLSRQGRPNRRVARALLEELPDDPSGRDHERALLATAALHLGGDETVEDDLRDLIANPNIDDQTRRGTGDLYSAARHEGLILDVAIEVFGTDHDLLEGLVETVADRLVDADVGELNIHELGWSVAALGRWAERQAGDIPEARLIAAGRQIEPAVVGDDGSRSWQLHRASEYPEVHVEFDEAPDKPVSVFRRTEGVHEDADAQFGSERLSLQRRFLDVNGLPVDLDDVEIGDLVYVQLEATHDENRDMENLALTDRIPGGFEIEDPRPEGDLRPDWYDATNQWDVDHFDVRDDRLEIFGSIPRRRGIDASGGQTVTFVYSIRATTAGTFDTPPAELLSMYQHDRWARIGGDTVRIHRR